MRDEFYKKREFCKDIGCEVQQELDRRSDRDCMLMALKDQCRSDCPYSNVDFEMWMKQQGYKLRPTMNVEEEFSSGTCWQYHDWLQKWGVEIVRTDHDD